MIIEDSIILAFVAMLFWGVGDFLIQRNVRRIGNLESLFFLCLIGAVGMLPWVMSEHALLLSLENLLFLGLLGLLTFGVAWLNFEALKQGNLSVVDVVLELELPVVIVLGFFFFRESLSFWQGVVIGVLFIGILLVAMERFSLKHLFKRLEKGALIAVAAALGLGLLDFFTAASSRSINPLLAIWFHYVIVAGVSAFFVFRKQRISKLLRMSRPYSWWILGMAVFATLAWLAYAHAMEIHNIAVITAITESYPAVALFLGLWLNKERIQKHQYPGAFLALGGSIALAFFI